jgi:hypothetical protein
VIVGFGRSLPKGKLTVFSCDTEEEARELLVFACGTNVKGEFVARELARKQTLENLVAFSDRLQASWDMIHMIHKK